jgi:hypothetical protein
MATIGMRACRTGRGPAALTWQQRGFLAQAEFGLGLVPWDKRFIAIAADGGVKLSSVFQIFHAFRQAGKLSRKALDGRDKLLILEIIHEHPSSA